MKILSKPALTKTCEARKNERLQAEKGANEVRALLQAIDAAYAMKGAKERIFNA